jgi:hypothetical protein
MTSLSKAHRIPRQVSMGVARPGGSHHDPGIRPVHVVKDPTDQSEATLAGIVKTVRQAVRDMASYQPSFATKKLTVLVFPPA